MRREIEFVKCNPTQNMTILVRTGQQGEGDEQLASAIMAYEHVHAEQVGFIEPPTNREAAALLRMAGGEFCGNACMALAAWLAAENGLQPDGGGTDIVLEASGTERLVACTVRKIADEYRCKVTMPAPVRIEPKKLRLEGGELAVAIVRYPEFLHIVIEVERVDEAIRSKAETLAELLGAVTGASVIGILLFRPDVREMAPLIHVPPLGSMIWERGCGSGTASIGAFLAWRKQGPVEAEIRQPGGTIAVSADWNGDAPMRLSIEGSVGIVAQGKAYVDVQVPYEPEEATG